MTEKQHERKARFKTLFKELNLDRQLVANALGYKKGYLNQILSADKNLSDAAALKFTKWYKKVNEDWLLDGVGEMLNPTDGVNNYQIDEGHPRTLEELEEEYKADPLAGLRDLIARVEELEKWKAEWDSRLRMQPKQEE
jgi:transcriptional regulator with XRE-family HTH domain